MKFLKSFKRSINEYNIRSICKKYNITNYTINPDGSIDVNGDVDLSGIKLDHLPLKFGRVNGNFYCYNNRLTSLEGCPTIVEYDFYCNNNKLTTLKYFPKVGGRIVIGNNKLPKEIRIICFYDQLLKKVIEYQDDYSIWNSNGTLNQFRFEELMDEVKEYAYKNGVNLPS